MAPELLSNIKSYENDLQLDGDVDYEKCDIFSLGLTLIYIVLRKPLCGCNQKHYVLMRTLASIDTDHVYLPEEFRLMLRKMTA